METWNQREQARLMEIRQVRNELSIDAYGLVLKGQQIVILQPLWGRAIEVAHLRHQRVEEMKKRLKTGSWFPGMDTEVESQVERCNTCVAESKEQDTALPNTEGNPSASWSRVSLNLCRLPNEQLAAILIDNYSKFPVIETLWSTSFQDIGTALEKDFPLIGIPNELDFDNKPPLHGHALRDYLTSLGVVYCQIAVTVGHQKG